MLSADGFPEIRQNASVPAVQREHLACGCATTPWPSTTASWCFCGAGRHHRRAGGLEVATMLRRRLLRRIAYLRRNRCSVLLAGLFVFILVHPLLAESAIGGTFLALGMLGILLLGLWALHARRRTLLIVGILALLTFHGIAADRLGEHWLRPATLLVTATFMGAITAALLYYVLDWHPITVDKVFGAVAAYVLIAFTFACVFGAAAAGPAGCLPRCPRCMRPTTSSTGRL